MPPESCHPILISLASELQQSLSLGFWFNYSSRSSLHHPFHVPCLLCFCFLSRFLSRLHIEGSFGHYWHQSPFRLITWPIFLCSLASFSDTLAGLFLILSDLFARLGLFCVLVACVFSLWFKRILCGLDLRIEPSLLWLQCWCVFLFSCCLQLHKLHCLETWNTH